MRILRDFLKRRVARPSVDWLWPLALLALPGCADLIGVDDWNPASASTTLVFCDIPKPPPPDGPQCASPDEVAFSGIRLAAAAVALNTGQTTNIGLDESPAALAACANNFGSPPQRVEFQGPFPQGLPGCADPATIIDANAVCVALCKGEISDAGFCSSNAHASTNVPVLGFPGGCSGEGAPIPDFDPRKNPEEVVWDWDPANPNGVSPTGNDLKRTDATSQPPDFDAGAASKQRIEHGDAYVEFSAAENDKSHVIGLSEIPDPNVCAPPCTDTDRSLTDINFAISLNVDHRVYVFESGVQVTGPEFNGSFGTYDPNDPNDPNPRFRVSLRQSADGTKTAIVTYSRLTAACIPGNPCLEDVFWTSDGLATYPLRVDTSFREANATLTNVTVVRIQNP
jgi:hypothetical protein